MFFLFCFFLLFVFFFFFFFSCVFLVSGLVGLFSTKHYQRKMPLRTWFPEENTSYFQSGTAQSYRKNLFCDPNKFIPTLMIGPEEMSLNTTNHQPWRVAEILGGLTKDQ